MSRSYHPTDPVHRLRCRAKADALRCQPASTSSRWPLGLLRPVRTCLLLQHGDAHRDVEPVDPVFAAGMQIGLHPPHILTSVRHEHRLLIVL